MSSIPPVSRRRFIQTSAAAVAAVPTISSAVASSANLPVDDGLKGRIYKTLKIGMVRVPGSLTDKFAAAKEAGFDGIELNSPGVNIEETQKAIAETGLPVDGTVCSTHWQVRHSDPSAEVRAKALENLMTAIRQTKAVGGHTALLVIGHGKDGSKEETWERSITNIRKALPLAGELGIYIAIENVWNSMLYDHGGETNQSADDFVKYVDELDSPWVGMQFDIGNHWKYGNPGDWIRTLGRRVTKLDIKGFSRKKDGFTKIGEGDLPWADVRKALNDINFYGWCAAEVGGGDLDRLKEVSRNMDQALGL